MRNKAMTGLIVALVTICATSTMSFAETEKTVTSTQDKITVTKTAEWTTKDGKREDAKGNPYAKISFKIDTTQADTAVINEVSKGGSTDVMLVLDVSGSMENDDKIGKAKKAAIEFTKAVMNVTTAEVKVGVCSFSNSAKIYCDLTSDKNAVTNAINSLQTDDLTNMVSGICKATDILEKNSNAKNKIIVLLGDGMPNIVGQEKSELVPTTAHAAIYTTEEITTIAADKAKRKGIKFVTIGYDTGAKAEKLLKDCASENESNVKMYYKAGIEATTVVSDLAKVFDKITEKVESYIVGNSLIDIIPEEFDVVDGTITCNDNAVKITLGDDNKTITWSWGDNKLEKKVYEMSVITSLDKTKVPADYFTDKKDIYTNGKTINTSTDSLGSSIFGYGGTGVIKLTSPKLELGKNLEEVEVSTDEKNSVGEITVETEEIGNDVDETPKTADSFNAWIIVLACICAVVIIKSAFVMCTRGH